MGARDPPWPFVGLGTLGNDSPGAAQPDVGRAIVTGCRLGAAEDPGQQQRPGEIPAKSGELMHAVLEGSGEAR
jgi:hypothetical protein